MKKTLLLFGLSTILILFENTSYSITENKESNRAKILSEENCSLDKFLTEQFQLIETNIVGTSLEEKFKQAKVILLLETHIAGGGQIPNSELINREWQDGDQLLTEGLQTLENKGSPSTVALLKNPQISHQHASWDDHDLNKNASEGASKLVEVTNQSFFLIVQLSLESLAIYYPELETRVDNEKRQKFIELAQSILHFQSGLGIEKNADISKMEVPDPLNMSPTMRFEFLCSLIPVVISNFQKVGEFISGAIDETFFARNKNMVQKILENLFVLKYNRVWLIAGSNHGQYVDDKYKESVDYLYDNLQKENIPYITLCARKRATLGDSFRSGAVEQSSRDPVDFAEVFQEEEVIVKEEDEKSEEDQFYHHAIFDKETHQFTTHDEWRNWILNTQIQKITEMQDNAKKNVMVGVVDSMDFCLYCLIKIYCDDVLLMQE